MDWSTLAVEQVRGKSRLVACQSRQPLKVFNPHSPTAACHLVLSSYGGGLVAGDHIRLRLSAAAQTRTFLGTQASTKVFRSIDGTVAEQHTAGWPRAPWPSSSPTRWCCKPAAATGSFSSGTSKPIRCCC